MIRGFKKWADDEATLQRSKLGLSKFAPLDPVKLADYHDILVYPVNGINDMPLEISTTIMRDGYKQFHALAMLTETNKKLIIYNPRNGLSRRNSDLMHELSHFICGHSFDSKNEISENIYLREFNQEDEEEAEWLSGCLLFPKCAALTAEKYNKNPTDVCEEYGISSQMYRYRINVTGAKKIFASKKAY